MTRKQLSNLFHHGLGSRKGHGGTTRHGFWDSWVGPTATGSITLLDRGHVIPNLKANSNPTNSEVVDSTSSPRSVQSATYHVQDYLFDYSFNHSPFRSICLSFANAATRQRLRFVGSQLFKFPQLSSFCSYSPTIVTVGDLARAIDKLGFKTTGNRIGIALPLTPKQLYKFRLWTRRTDRYDTGRQLCWYSCLVSAEVE